MAEYEGVGTVDLKDAVAALKENISELKKRDDISTAHKAQLEEAHTALERYLESQEGEALKTALGALIKGTDWQALSASMLAFFSGLFAFSANNAIIPQLPLAEWQKSLLLSLPALTAMYSRLKEGIAASTDGGCAEAVMFIQLSAAGLLLTTVVSLMATTDWLGEVSLNTSVIFSLEMCAALLAGFGFASVSTVPNASAWFPKRRSGMVSALIAGLGGSTPSLSDLIFSFVNGSRAQNGILISFNVLLLVSIVTLRSESRGLLPTPYQQLMTAYGLSPVMARQLATHHGQELFSNENVAWKNYVGLLKSPSALIHNVNYAVFFGALFISWTSSLRLVLEALGYSAEDARLYSAVWSGLSSVARAAVGVPLPSMQHSVLDGDTTHGARVNFAGALLVALSSIAIASVPTEALYNPTIFLSLLLLAGIGCGWCNAATLKRISQDKSVDFYTTTALVASVGPLGSFMFPANSNIFLEFFNNKGRAYQLAFYVYAALAFAMGTGYLIWKPRDTTDAAVEEVPKITPYEQHRFSYGDESAALELTPKEDNDCAI